MQIATISSKRQLTLPKEMLLKLGLDPGSKVILQEREEEIFIRSLKKSIVEDLAGSLTRFISSDRLGVSFEKIMQATKLKTAGKLNKSS
ncbi:AbrB/MazE/SpoVT family DNA-binding domain-containing protein [Candidatus Gottesmanbacteria bacterium]|nr:AbrB/MazE/SpoVT family DNA-binding domain-containing protein [Candidatus Gottesmanbacteria bacterium]